MLHDYILNEMNVDELRNYAHHMNEIEDVYGALVFAKDDTIEKLQALYNSQNYAYDQLIKLQICRNKFVNFENEMKRKYETTEAEPKPVRSKE